MSQDAEGTLPAPQSSGTFSAFSLDRGGEGPQAGGDWRGWMEYSAPELRFLGSFAGLTMGTGGSCPDGNLRNVNQRGGGSIGGQFDPHACGPPNQP